MTVSERPVALITGAARGIGRGCAVALAKAGFNVLLNDRDGAEDIALLQSAARDIQALGGDAEIFACDVADLDLHCVLFAAALDKWGRLDVVMNNAGVSVKSRGDILDVEVDSYDYNLSVNTRAVFFLTQRAAKYMLAQGQIGDQHRAIINVTSCNVVALALNRGEYCVSKAASSMTTKLFSLRLAEEGIGVYEIQPGIIETEMTRPSKAKYDKLIAEGLVPMKRWGQPEDIAKYVVSMAEGQMPYSIGQAVLVDGGLTIPNF
ncbi:3-ketoacyl-ACP reductase [Pseudovibrio sp. SPO723]|uniref:3-ketoacyl-ACP reductase n=1 Tax=Nesiotobacter zosterae TaxID=392721 RepID=UPI0029C3401F|nr:3-ketoacyl-ACP reductase [Pseudovibrio sp. SPO723]MDX5593411.1 3-ketoacyl-ACP reductase [Pseudovibrio sp. SPO723]